MQEIKGEVNADVSIADRESDIIIENEKLKKENKRLSERDCNATIQLCYDDGFNPFAREDLKVLDVGVADNCYVVESEIINKLLEENKKLKEEIEKLFSNLDKIRAQRAQERAKHKFDVGKLKEENELLKKHIENIKSKKYCTCASPLYEAYEETINGSSKVRCSICKLAPYEI